MKYEDRLYKPKNNKFGALLLSKWNKVKVNFKCFDSPSLSCMERLEDDIKRYKEIKKTDTDKCWTNAILWCEKRLKDLRKKCL